MNPEETPTPLLEHLRSQELPFQHWIENSKCLFTSIIWANDRTTKLCENCYDALPSDKQKDCSSYSGHFAQIGAGAIVDNCDACGVQITYVRPYTACRKCLLRTVEYALELHEVLTSFNIPPGGERYAVILRIEDRL